MDELEPFYVAALARCQGMGSGRVRELCDALGGGRAAWEAGAAAWREAVPKLPKRAAEAALALRREQPDYPERLAEICHQKQIEVITIWQPEYPNIMKEIYEPPAVVYVRGTVVPDAIRCAMVGARQMTGYGEAVATELGEKLAAAGLTIVSGGARGIDTCSHKGAIRAARKGHGRTVAVLGCGVDVAYPASNRRLFEEILETGGALVSERVPGTKPLPAFFPARNRIIAGLSQGTVVVEAARRSGSLITAELALSSGRDVFAVPGSIFSPKSEGCHKLLQQGAKLVQQPADILEEFGLAVPQAAPKSRELPPEQRRVWQVLSFEHPLTLDEIVESLPDGDVSTLAFTLLQMEMEGLVQENAMHGYRRMERE